MKRTAISLSIGCLLLSAPHVARAQEEPAATAPEYDPRVQPYVAAPPYLLPVDVAELERRGQEKKIAGAVMMILGGALNIVAIGLTIDVLANKPPLHCTGHEEHIMCDPSPADTELNVTYAAAVTGQLLLLAGIPVYVVGSVQVARARRLSTQWAVQPLVSRAGAGAVATVGFRF
jgi:hypothetical protein